MKKKIKQFGLSLALIATFFLVAHVGHADSGATADSGHHCTLCQTPTFSAKSAPLPLSPSLVFTATEVFPEFIPAAAETHPATQPRAPPAH